MVTYATVQHSIPCCNAAQACYSSLVPNFGGSCSLALTFPRRPRPCACRIAHETGYLRNCRGVRLGREEDHISHTHPERLGRRIGPCRHILGTAFSVLYTTSVTRVSCSLVPMIWTLARFAWTLTRIIGTGFVRIISAVDCSAGSLTAFRTGAKLNGGGIVELYYQRNRSAPEQGAQARVLSRASHKLGAGGWL